ncbi:MAG: TrkH family potassium uptake protein [Bacteroidota bacterium]
MMKAARTHRRIHLSDVLGILGGFMVALAIAMLLPILIALLYGETTWVNFLQSSVLCLMAGGILFYFFRPRDELRMREAFLIVSLTWLVGSLVGALPFWLSGTLINYTDAVFEIMSGFSTTGSSILGGTTHEGVVNPAIESIDRSLLFWRSLTHWIGGMGIILLTLALLPLLGIGGMQLFKAEYSGSTADKVTPRIQETAKLLWTVYVGLTCAQYLLLWIHPSMDWFDAINHAFSTLATGGFSTKNASIGAFDSIYIESVIILFMFLAGINFALHFRLFTGRTSAVFQNSELRFYTVLTLLFVAGVTLSLWLANPLTLGQALRSGSFQVVSILTTTGFGTDDYTLWPHLSFALLFVLFFTGGCAGSTSGGIKMLRISIILKNIQREFRQTLHPHAVLPIRLGQRIVSPSVLRTILSFLMLYLLLFLTGFVLLAGLGYDPHSAMSASIASIGNIGPGWGDFGPSESYAHIPLIGKWVLIVLMMIGRLEIITVLILFTPWFWKN